MVEYIKWISVFVGYRNIKYFYLIYLLMVMNIEIIDKILKMWFV